MAEGRKHRASDKDTMSDARLTLVFTQWLSGFLVTASVMGALLVLIDPKGAVTIAGQSIQFGGAGFAEQMKGAVIMLILIGGFTAVVNFWLRISNQEARAQETTNAIAKEAAPAAAEATRKALDVVASLPPVTPAPPAEAVVTPDLSAAHDGIIPAAESTDKKP